MIDMAPTTADTMQRYFDTWKAHGFDDLQALLADNVTFKGPLGTADDAASYRAGIEDISKIMTDIVIHTMAADGENVVALFDLHTTEADEPVLVANWAQVGADRRIKRIRLTFDPPPDPLVTAPQVVRRCQCARARARAPASSVGRGSRRDGR